MLYIDYGVTSSVTVTLFEKCQNVTNPVFTWVVDGGDNRQSYTFSVDDFSVAPWYFNQFTFSSTAIPIGQYVYTVYEMAEYDLDIANSVGEVETGILNIVGTASLATVFEGGTNIVTVFKK